MNNYFFIDWLSVNQLYDYPIPVFAGSIIRETNCETGEQIEFKKFASHKGSYSTTINIKSDGSRLFVSGNPSRFNRLDNLFGFQSVESCIALYNQQLQLLGLPKLTVNTAYKTKFNNKTRKFDVVGNGVRITQVHITHNVCVGKGNESAYLRGISSFSYNNKVGFLYPDNFTVDWNKGSRSVYLKCYNKAESMIRERKKLVRKYNDLELAYYDAVIKYCQEVGVCRHEGEYKSNFLTYNNMQWWGMGNNIESLFKLNPIEEKINLSNENVCVKQGYSVADELIQNSVVMSRQAANATQHYYMLWCEGVDLRSILSKTQFYEHRNRLLKIGYDITQVLDIKRSPLRFTHDVEIEVNEVDLPSWYNHAII